MESIPGYDAWKLRSDRDEYPQEEPEEYDGPDEPREMHHGAPRCRCGSRNTTRIGDSALQRFCHACGHTYRYVLKDGILVPHSLETALALEGK